MTDMKGLLCNFSGYMLEIGCIGQGYCNILCKQHGKQMTRLIAPPFSAGTFILSHCRNVSVGFDCLLISVHGTLSDLILGVCLNLEHLALD